MSSKRKKTRGNPANPPQHQRPREETAVWIRTEPTVDGKSFMVTIEIDEDHSLALDRANANTYAYAILEAVARASYDAAVYTQITTKLVKNKRDPEEVKRAEHAGINLVVDLRRDRPDIDFSVMAPMSFTPGVNQKGQPFLYVNHDGEPVGQWDLRDARDHALGILEAIVVAELDSGYLRALRGIVGLDEETSRRTVDNLLDFRKDYLL